jgi:hypothetical protein
VKTRAIPLQPLFEIGFPHGRDQWISAAATNSAAMALARPYVKRSSIAPRPQRPSKFEIDDWPKIAITVPANVLRRTSCQFLIATSEPCMSRIS